VKNPAHRAGLLLLKKLLCLGAHVPKQPLTIHPCAQYEVFWLFHINYFKAPFYYIGFTDESLSQFMDLCKIKEQY
jgi:hypothetical protein